MFPRIEAVLVARTVVMFALFPALAGCLVDEPLDRADVRAGGATERDATVPWASPEEAAFRPGDPIHTEVGDCPTSFFFTRPDTGAVFLATTAYCTRELPIGSTGTIGPQQTIVVLIYNSFQTMAEVDEREPEALEYNDLALFHLDTASRSLANPSIPGGGPKAAADNGAIGAGDRLKLFVHDARLPAQLEWRDGIVAASAGEWAFLTYTPLPGAPGTLGGPVVDAEGRAVGVLATLGVLPNPGAHGVARLDTMLAYASAHAKLPVTLATWDAPTAPPESS